MDPVTNRAVIGVDIGQKTDPTAIVVAEHQDRGGTMHYPIRLVERLPLGTGYPDVAARIEAVVHGVEQRARQPFRAPDAFPVDLIVDATGVGLAVVDMLRDRGLRPTACLLTAGDRRVERTDNTLSIGKAWLVSRLQVLLQSSRIHLPRTAEAAALAKELGDYEIRVNANANVQTGAFKTGAHDDLVTALGLAVGADSRPAPARDVSAFAPVDLYIGSQRVPQRRRRLHS